MQQKTYIFFDSSWARHFNSIQILSPKNLIIFAKSGLKNIRPDCYPNRLIIRMVKEFFENLNFEEIRMQCATE